jgi:osmotically-inducible protein OsmY
MNKTVDETIKKRVIDHLYWDSRLDASKITVEVNNQKVRLSGTVPTYKESEVALFDTWNIPKVQGVENKLFVKYPSAIKPPTDSEIKKRIMAQLDWRTSISESDIEVSVDNGNVTLQGHVDAYWKKFRMEQIISDTKGVVQIENKISIVPTKTIMDKKIAEDISQAIDRSIAVDIENLDVRVEKGKVTLSGDVRSPIARDAALEITRNTLGVIDLANRLSLK